MFISWSKDLARCLLIMMVVLPMQMQNIDMIFMD
jgi:hypothetical protein